MNTKRFLLSVIIMSCCVAQAQQPKQRTVVDGDTGRPIANVTVTGKGFTLMTDSTGHFTLPEGCKTVVFSHVGYVSYMANLNDLGDNVELYTNDYRLSEVVVFGAPTGKDPLANLNERLGISKTEAQLISANPNCNLLGLLKYLIPKKWRVSKKERRKEQLKKILEDY